MTRRWPERTKFKIRFNEEERIDILDAPKGSGNRIDSKSPLGEALHGWLSNPGPTVTFLRPGTKDEAVSEVLGFELPAGGWVENRPELWEAVKLVGLIAILVGPEKGLSVAAEMRELGLEVEALRLQNKNELERLIQWARSKEPPDEFVEKVAPRDAYKGYLDRLNQGEYRFAPKISALLRDGLNEPWKSYRFVKEWKDRIPSENKHNLQALLTSGIGTINYLWNEHETSDASLLKEALLWGKKALAIKKNSYTYCALQSVFRALNRGDLADMCLKKAKALGKPCEINRRTIRPVSIEISAALIKEVED